MTRLPNGFVLLSGKFEYSGGSALREDFHNASDLDLLVEYLPNAKVTLLDMAQQEMDLGKVMGLRVDLRTPCNLSRYFRQRVVDDAVMIYERSNR